MRRRIFTLALVLVGTGLLLLWSGRAGDNALDAVYAQARALGFPTEELQLLRGEYATHMFSQSAVGDFVSKARPEMGRIRIAVERPLPFFPWRLSAVSTTPEKP